MMRLNLMNVDFNFIYFILFVLSENKTFNINILLKQY